jgi:hypothetical protein
MVFTAARLPAALFRSELIRRIAFSLIICMILYIIIPYISTDVAFSSQGNCRSIELKLMPFGQTQNDTLRDKIRI